jgi:hypothetical protein
MSVTIQVGVGGRYVRLLTLTEPVRVEKSGNGLALVESDRRHVFDALGRFIRTEEALEAVA